MNKAFTNDTSIKLFTSLLIVMLIIVLAIGGILFWLSFYRTSLLYQFLIFFSTFLFLTVGVSISLTIYTILLLCYNKKVPFMVKNIMESFLHMIYPIMLSLGKIMGYNKDTIRRAYTKLNNQLVLKTKYNLKGEEILILTPHCIQKSFCPHKITNDINNCKRCGLCNVDKLLDLKDKYKVIFKVVTGGTIARKLILDFNPKAIIAIACERDLFSGLMDIKKIPILAIVNKRPEGPCINTEVDLLEVQKAIIHFIKE